MKRIHLDFETASDVELDEVGLQNYLHHPSTRVLLASWCDPEDGAGVVQRTYEDGWDYLRAVVSVSDEIHAWNAPFEWGVMTVVLGWPVPIERMRCSMAHALYRAFPASLDECCAAMGIPGKSPEATRLLNLWASGKGKAKPGDWEKFCAYNRNDVVIEMGTAEVLKPLPWPENERQIWMLSEQINWTGTPIDVEAAAAAAARHELETGRALEEMQRLTGVSNANSPQQIAKWLGVKSLAKEHLPSMLKGATGDRRRVIELRQQVALSAPKKYTTALRQHYQRRMFNMLQYSGAGRTHRWSGRGLQPQNLRRGWKKDAKIQEAWDAIFVNAAIDKPFDMLADLVRSIIRAENGGLLCVADYSSIEVVMLHWLCQDQPTLDLIRAGLDTYKQLAAQHFGLPIEEVTDEQRTWAKPVRLGCGYGLGAKTLVDYAAGMGVEMDESEAYGAVSTYRQNNQAVVEHWYGLESAMRQTIQTGKSKKFGRILYRMVGKACVMVLPSGAEITYWDAVVDGDGSISYMGVHQYTGQWTRIRTWGGKVIENAVQSISRDVLVYGMRKAANAGLRIVLHVHDELVTEDRHSVFNDLEILIACMVAPPWCFDAPIKANGFRCPRYRKD